jgi:hypothetical protein
MRPSFTFLPLRLFPQAQEIFQLREILPLVIVERCAVRCDLSRSNLNVAA